MPSEVAWFAATPYFPRASFLRTASTRARESRIHILSYTCRQAQESEINLTTAFSSRKRCAASESLKRPAAHEAAPSVSPGRPGAQPTCTSGKGCTVTSSLPCRRGSLRVRRRGRRVAGPLPACRFPGRHRLLEVGHASTMMMPKPNRDRIRDKPEPEQT
jgi:hypothetical protein